MTRRTPAADKGAIGIKAAVRKRVQDSVGRVYHMDNGTVQPFRDGAQTPFRGNVIYSGNTRRPPAASRASKCGTGFLGAAS